MELEVVGEIWNSMELFLRGFHFIPLLRSSWKCPQMPPRAPAGCPSHNTSFPTPLLFLLFSLLKWRSEREQAGFRVGQIRRERNQGMFWGHDCCSTWSSTEVAQVRQVELLGEEDRGRPRVGHQALISVHLIILFWPSPKYTHWTLCFFKPRPCKWIIETFKWVMSGNSWRLIQFLPKETDEGCLYD